MQNPDPNFRQINNSFVEITENMTTLFGGAVSAIIGFYFGQRAVEARQRRITGTSVAGKPGPFVVSTFPSDGSSGVAVIISVKATFSEALNGPTVNKSTFTLKVNKTQELVDGSVNLSDDGKTVEYKPAASLSQSSLYVVTISGVKDLSGTY